VIGDTPLTATIEGTIMESGVIVPCARLSYFCRPLAILRLAVLTITFLAQADSFRPSSSAADSQSARSDSVSRICMASALRNSGGLGGAPRLGFFMP
jgi:hypothetical protein